MDAAIQHFSGKPCALEPKLVKAHTWLAEALHARGALDEAIDHFQEAIRLDPKGAAEPLCGIGVTMGRMLRFDEAIGYYTEALRLDPASSGPTAHFNIGAILHLRGQHDEAISHFQEAIRLNPNGSADAHLELGQAFRDKGRFGEAVAEYRRTVEHDPVKGAGHENLADALLGTGRFAEARSAIRYGLDVLPSKDAHRPAMWKKLSLCERLLAVAGNLPALLQNKAQLSAGELLELARLCSKYGRPDGAADLYAAAFAARPALADDIEAADRYNAASAAVRAAAGEGSAQEPLGESGRADLRQRALAWLRADLTLSTKLMSEGKGTGSLANWQTDPDLASVRDPAAQAKLPDSEREPWRRLWTDVPALLAADPLEQGKTHAARRNWVQAADCYARVTKGGPTDDGHVWFEYAALLLLSGDRPGYAKACAKMIERCGKDGGPRSHHVARACTLAPDAVADASLPGRLADKELKDSAQAFWSLTEQGALEYRAGRFGGSRVSFRAAVCRRMQRPVVRLVNWAWLALASQAAWANPRTQAQLG